MNSQKRVPLRVAGMAEAGVLITIAVMVLVAAVTFWIYPNLDLRYKKYLFGSQLSLVYQAMNDFKGASQSYSGSSLSTLCAKDYIKGSICDEGLNPWGGSITIGADTDASKVAITADVKSSKVASALQNDYEKSDWTVTISGTTVKLVR